MKNHICISTGCIYKLSNDRNDLIAELRQFSPVGIELSFAYPEYLLNFNISDENLNYLRSLKFNSIHAPVENISYGKNKISKEILQKISELYKRVNAKNVVFHKESTKDYSSIISNDFISSIENDDWRKPNHNVENIKSILDKNEELKFTFDVAHAISVSSSDILKYINSFQNKLIEIHISIMDKKIARHDFLYKYDSAEIKNSLQPLKKLSVPLVLEATISSSEEIESIGKEIEYIRKI
ncbi:MAG: hypothetical protein ABIG99_01510 [Patescibacteria group bacterium]